MGITQKEKTVMNIFLSENVKSALWKVLFFILLILDLYFAYEAFGNGHVLFFPFAALPCSFVLALVAMRAFFGGVAEGFSFSLLGPRSFLKKAPLILSPYYKMFSDEKYLELYQELTPLVEEYPDDPELVLIYAKSCMKLENGEGYALQSMENLFKKPVSAEHTRKRVELLFFYTEIAIKYRDVDVILSIMENDLKDQHYSDDEAKSIFIRMESIRRRYYGY